MENLVSQTQPVEERTGVIANPVPLGMLALAFTTALIGCSFTHFLVPSLRTGIGLAISSAIFFGGLVQLLAGMWEFRRNRTSTATIFAAYGGFLIAFGFLFLPTYGLSTLLGFDNITINHAIGLLFLCWTICSAVLFLGMLGTNLLVSLVMGLLCLAFLFLTIGEFANANFVLLAIGGWIAIACALVAWYTALATMLRPSGLRETVSRPIGSPDSPMRSTEGYAGYQ